MDGYPPSAESFSAEAALERGKELVGHLPRHSRVSVRVIRILRALVSFSHCALETEELLIWRCDSLNIVAIVDWANPIPDLFFCTCTSSSSPLLSSFPAHPTYTDIAPTSWHRRLPHIRFPTRHLANLVQHRFSTPKLSRPPFPLQTLPTLLSHHPRPGYWTSLRGLPLLLIPLLRPCFSVSSLAGSISIPLYPYSLGP